MIGSHYLMIRLFNQMIEQSNPIDVIGLSNDWSSVCSLYLMMSSVVSDDIGRKYLIEMTKNQISPYTCTKKEGFCPLSLFELSQPYNVFSRYNQKITTFVFYIFKPVFYAKFQNFQFLSYIERLKKQVAICVFRNKRKAFKFDAFCFSQENIYFKHNFLNLWRYIATACYRLFLTQNCGYKYHTIHTCYNRNRLQEK